MRFYGTSTSFGQEGRSGKSAGSAVPPARRSTHSYRTIRSPVCLSVDPPIQSPVFPMIGLWILTTVVLPILPTVALSIFLPEVELGQDRAGLHGR